MDRLRSSIRLFVIVSVGIAIVASLLSSSQSLRSRLPWLKLRITWPDLKFNTTISPGTRNVTTGNHSSLPHQLTMPGKTPVYFFSHGGPDVQYNTKHPVYPVLQSIGQEITQKVKPKAVVVFSAHWQAKPNEIHLNNAIDTDLIYDFYGFPASWYEAKYPNKGDPELASKILDLLGRAGIRGRGLKRGLDHGVFSGFHVAFHPDENPLGVPLVQVSLFKSEDPEAHYRLGEAVASLRDEGVVIIGAGMSVHNLQNLRLGMRSPHPLPYVVSFDDALKEAVEADPAVRRERMAAIIERPDFREAHPWADHLMPVYIAAGAAGVDVGKQTWTLHEGAMAWAQYRFGEVPA